MILPVTSDSIDQAIAVGGSVTIMRRWTKAVIKKMKEDSEIIGDIADTMMKEMSQKRPTPNNKDTKKEMADAAGIKTGGGDKHYLVYETWANLKVDGEWRLAGLLRRRRPDPGLQGQSLLVR